MNAYFCNAGWHDIVQEIIDYWPRTEPAFLCDVVFAETLGKAKAMFLRHANNEVMGTIEFVDVRAKAIARDVRRRAGIAKSSDPLWARVPAP